VVWSADYLPFGQADVTVETVENNLRFAGQYYDSETGLHYNYHRYYDPKLGRYLRADPSHAMQAKGTAVPFLIPRLLKTPAELNNYVFARDNPIRLVDYFGLEGKSSTYEGHALIGLGFLVVKCCNKEKRKMRHIYFKRCIGIAAGGGASFSGPMFNEEECSNPPEDIYMGFELGFSVGPFTCEFGGPLDHEGFSLGAGAGLKCKGTFCSYSLEGSKDIGCCDKE
jgi:RHS repeat-associated protein